MTYKCLTPLAALAAILLTAGRTKADLLAVENGVPAVLRFSGPLGTRSTFATVNLDSPIGIALDSSRNVYVVNNGTTATSTFTNSVAKFSPTGTPLGFFVTPATPPGNTLNGPVGIAFDGANNAYVTSGTNPNPPYGYVASYSAAGAYQNSFGLADTNLPSGIRYNPANGLLYVANAGTSSGPNPNSILVYNPANTSAAPTIITPAGAGALDGPQQITTDAAGNLFVASFGTASGVAKVQEYTPYGTYIRTVATLTGGGAEGVAFDPATGTLYASYLNTGTIEKYVIAGGTVTDAGPLATGLSGPAYLYGVVPEPTSLCLLGLGMSALLFRRRRA